MRQVQLLLVGALALTVGCASAPTDGSEVPVLAEVGSETMPLDLEAVVASSLAMQAAPSAPANRASSSKTTASAAGGSASFGRSTEHGFTRGGELRSRLGR